MTFELQGQFIDERVEVRAERRGPELLVITAGELRRAADLSRAIRISCGFIGPLMERGDRAGGGWGLMVSAGPASVAYGNWPAGPPREPGPELEMLRRILAAYRPHDGARGALENAVKVIEAYSERPARTSRKAA